MDVRIVFNGSEQSESENLRAHQECLLEKLC